MGLIKLVRGLFNRVQPANSLAWLDTVVTHNEVQLEDLKAEIGKVEGLLNAEEGKIRSKAVEGRQKKFTLQAIKRLRTHLSALERRMDILDRNIAIGVSLISKIKDMEAMALQGIKTDQIDSVILEFEERMNDYLTTASAEIEPTDSICDEKELEDLEKEILGVREQPQQASIDDVLQESSRLQESWKNARLLREAEEAMDEEDFEPMLE